MRQISFLYKLIEIANPIIIYSTMEGCEESTTIYVNTTTTFTRDGTIVAKRIIEIDGARKTEHWYNSVDNFHRDGDLPARIQYDDGKITCQVWYKDGKYSRDVGPAYIEMKNGIIKNYWMIGKSLYNITHVDLPEERRLSPEFRQAMKVLPLPIGQAITCYCIQTWYFVEDDCS